MKGRRGDTACYVLCTSKLKKTCKMTSTYMTPPSTSTSSEPALLKVGLTLRYVLHM